MEGASRDSAAQGPQDAVPVRDSAEDAPAASDLHQPCGNQITAVHPGALRIPSSLRCSVAALEHELLKAFPAQDAEPWDRTGLVVGDPSQAVEGIAIALDATVEAVRIAAECGANVLITHHPAFLDPPVSLCPFESDRYGSGAVVWEAVSRKVALIDFHTALDKSPAAARVLPGMLGMELQDIVDVVDMRSGKGYGQLCRMHADDEPLSLKQLAARCMAVFARPARVWGNENHRLESVVTCTGSAGDLSKICVERGFDCLICGEIRYHDALAAKEAGLAVIELGHDASELPLCALLAATVGKLGFPEESIKMIDQGSNWSTPEAIRK
jgi:putative NIF3 family GTP cyclohydrolase 1 type 2